MKFNPEIHRRRSIRLKNYDYSQAGAYFVTLCTHNRECLFGEILDDVLQLNESGRVLQKTWEDLPNHYHHVELDAWIIMPNHVHGVIILTPASTNTRHGLPEIIRALKSFSSRHINKMHGTPGRAIWQRNYWEHVIRNEADLLRITEYIQNNPAQWALDQLNPAHPWPGNCESS